MNDEFSLGIDIGGTKLAGTLVNAEGDIFSRVEHSTVGKSREILFETLLNCIVKVLEKNNTKLDSIKGIGIGVPGKVDVENGIAVTQNNIPWSNYPLVENLKNKFGTELEIIIDNDVKMAAYAEYKFADVSEDDVFTYVTISTGIGAASVTNDQIIRGTGFSGEIGFIPISLNNEYQTLENIASGLAIQKTGQNVYQNYELQTKEIFDKYYDNDESAIEIIENSAHYIALSLYSIICVLDPKIIILGGSVATNNPDFVKLIKKELSKFLVTEQKHILESTHISKIATDNGVVGAGLRMFDK